MARAPDGKAPRPASPPPIYTQCLAACRTPRARAHARGGSSRRNDGELALCAAAWPFARCVCGRVFLGLCESRQGCVATRGLRARHRLGAEGVLRMQGECSQGWHDLSVGVVRRWTGDVRVGARAEGRVDV
jgi:hypothetical protein